MDLIIVESPTKARTLSRFLGTGYRIEASMGHIRDLPEKKLGIDVEKNFEPSYVQTKKQKQRIDEIKVFAKSADKIFLATDPDREGEAIAWHVSQVLGAKGQVLSRVTFHEITKSAIDNALKNPGALDLNLVDAQQARRILDRLVGYKLSPLLWKKVRRGLSAGRVQSVAVRLVVEREREIEAFKTEEYWEILVKLKNSKNQKLETKLITELKNQSEAERIEKGLISAQYEVASIEKKDFKRTPPAPFTTSTLQQIAANKLGWSAKKTMQTAQRL
ncbi:MAG: DNA topoisomerase, partial [Patescibacteria group bacterium]